jgi:hypothetical protein
METKQSPTLTSDADKADRIIGYVSKHLSKEKSKKPATYGFSKPSELTVHFTDWASI